MPTATKTRTLSTAEQRRGELVDAAVHAFAEHGYAAPTTEIAKTAGISQAYLFRLFPTKAELFVAAFDATSERMRAAFREAASRARAEGANPLEEMGKAYGDLLERDRDLLRVQMHAQVAAGSDPLIRDSVQRCFAGLYEMVTRESGARPEELRDWFARGMLCNVMAAIDADQIGEPWAQALTGDDGAT
jgi:AcrR family transcriptional regulator